MADAGQLPGRDSVDSTKGGARCLSLPLLIAAESIL